MTTAERWHAIVVGGGTAGCAAAAVIAESGARVLLIEAGPGEPRPATVAGMDTIAAAEEPSRQWPGQQARVAAEQPLFAYRQGLGLGGSSMINSMILSPGHTDDYRRWERDHGCVGWGPADMVPWLTRALEAFPVRTVPRGPLSERFAAAAADAGHAVGGSTLDQDRLGLLRAGLAASDDGRWSVVEAFLGGDLTAADRNPMIVTGRSAARLVVDGRQAVGVVTDDGREHRTEQIILATGAIRTPELLVRSGLAHRPVGARLKDHPSVTFTVRLSGDAVIGSHMGGSEIGGEVPLRTISTLLRWSSSSDDPADLEAFVVDRVDDPTKGGRGPGGAMGVVVVGLMDVVSTGSVEGLSTGRPTPTTGMLVADSDRHRLRRGVADMTELLRSDQLRAVVDKVFIDDAGTSVDRLAAMTDDEVDRWLLANPGPYAHPAGTCPMGPAEDPGAVVDHRPGALGQLHGYRGIRLVDASVMPDLVRGGLQLPVVAVAQRIAAEIAG